MLQVHDDWCESDEIDSVTLADSAFSELTVTTACNSPDIFSQCGDAASINDLLANRWVHSGGAKGKAGNPTYFLEK